MRDQLLEHGPARLTLLYAGLAGAGGILSDWLVHGRFAAAPGLRVALVKDCAFVAVTAILLYLLLRREMGQLKRAHAALEEERIFHHALLQSLSEGIIATDAEGRPRVFNRAAEALLGTPAALRSGETGRGTLFEADGSTLYADRHDPMGRAQRGESFQDVEVVLRPKVGVPRTLLLHGDPIQRSDGRPLGAVLALLDVTETRVFAHMAFHDPLTELPNRALLMDRLRQALKSMDRRPRELALLFIDLDGFKPVNDRHGHQAGDRVLVQVGARLSQCLRPEDTLARMGGDEFALLLDGIEDACAALSVAARVAELVSEPFGVEGEALRVSASVGVALAHGTMSPEELLRRADVAMYLAKRSGPGGWVLFQAPAPEEG